MMQLIDRLNHARHKISSLGSLTLVVLVFTMAQSIKAPVEMVAQEALELTTALIEPLLQPPPKSPAVQQPRIDTQPKVIPLVTAQQAVAQTEAVKEMPASEVPRASVTPPANAQPVVTTQEAPKLVQQPPVNLNVENNYIASVRAILNANKRYPTGREASLQRPAGKVKLWFVLTRNGSLQEAGIDESSNSIILDNAALSTVRRTTYTPWPDGSWPSQSQHKFTVTLDFVPLN
jgi:protein TonB